MYEIIYEIISMNKTFHIFELACIARIISAKSVTSRGDFTNHLESSIYEIISMNKSFHPIFDHQSYTARSQKNTCIWYQFSASNFEMICKLQYVTIWLNIWLQYVTSKCDMQQMFSIHYLNDIGRVELSLLVGGVTLWLSSAKVLSILFR